MFFQSKTLINELMPLTPIDSQEIWLALNKTWERTIHWAFTPFFNILCSSNSMKDLEGSLSISFAYCSSMVTWIKLPVISFRCIDWSLIDFWSMSLTVKSISWYLQWHRALPYLKLLLYWNSFCFLQSQKHVKSHSSLQILIKSGIYKKMLC